MQRHIPTLLKEFHASPKMLTDSEVHRVGDALLRLQRGLTGERELSGAGYMQDKNLLGAYLLYYWPSSYVQIEHALRLSRLSLKKDSLKILDVGSGPAPASAALCDALRNVKKVTLLDSSEKALSLAKRIFTSDFKGINVETHALNFEKSFSAHDESSAVGAGYDIIVMSHALNELWQTKENVIQLRADFLCALSDHLSDDGLLFLMEPALLKTSRNLLSLRDELCARGFSVVSPCPFVDGGKPVCPALTAGENQTCHASFTWKLPEPVASLARYAKLDRAQVKMSFFVFRKDVPAGSASAPANECGTEKISGAPENSYTVVSEPMLNKSGRVRYLLCNGKERIPLSAKKDDSHAAKIGFFNLKRYDRISLKNPEIRGDGTTPALGVTEKTEISLV